MKKIFYSVLFIVAGHNAKAQPTLTAANSNPIIGDVFYNSYCDTPTVATGISGPNVTWDYSGLVISIRDTTQVVDCSSTPYCDSFPTSTLVEFTLRDSVYQYLKSILGTVEYIGEFMPASLGGAGMVHFSVPQKYGPYPVTYGDKWKDTIAYQYGTYYNSHILFRDSSNAEGYGTLITPAGVYINVLQVHTKRYVTDSEFSAGPVNVSYDSLEDFHWYAAGNHAPLLLIEKHLGASTVVKFSLNLPPTEVHNVCNEKSTYIIYPNPAGESVQVKNINGSMLNTDVMLCDLSGKKIWNRSNNNVSLNQSEVTIPVSSVVPGVYVLTMKSMSGTISRKITICKN